MPRSSPDGEVSIAVCEVFMALQIFDRWGASSSGSLVISLLVLIGIFEAFKALTRLSIGVYIYWIRPGKSLKRFGTWAVVTGATDGIGRAYADALAKQGLNVVLISRTKAKLEEAASEIGSKFRVKTLVVPADFSSATTKTWDDIASAVQPLDVGVLVNNVGLSYDHAAYLDELDEGLMMDLITVNVTSTTKMTRLVLPGLRKKNRGAIVNIGSAAATLVPNGPFYAVYAATKAYVDMFSKSLSSEYGPLGISVQNQAPMHVTTKMSKLRNATLTVPTPQAWVEQAVKHIGYEATSSPYWAHGVMWAALTNMPGWLNEILLYQHGWGMRKRYLKKLERSAKAK